MSAFLPPLPQDLPLSRQYHRVCLSTAITTGSVFVPPLPQGLPFYRLYHRVCLCLATATGSDFLPSLPHSLPLSCHYHMVCLSTVTTTGSAFVTSLPQRLSLSRRYHKACLCLATTTRSAFLQSLPQGLLLYRRYHRVCPICEDKSSSQPSAKSIWHAAAAMRVNCLPHWHLPRHKGRTHRAFMSYVKRPGEFHFPSVGGMWQSYPPCKCTDFIRRARELWITLYTNKSDVTKKPVQYHSNIYINYRP